MTNRGMCLITGAFHCPSQVLAQTRVENRGREAPWKRERTFRLSVCSSLHSLKAVLIRECCLFHRHVSHVCMHTRQQQQQLEKNIRGVWRPARTNRVEEKKTRGEKHCNGSSRLFLLNTFTVESSWTHKACVRLQMRAEY